MTIQCSCCRKKVEKRWRTYDLWANLSAELGYTGDKEMLTALYKENSLTAISEYLGVSRTGLAYHMRKLGIEIAPPLWTSPRKPNPLTKDV